MYDIDELYQEVIMDHNSRHRNFRPLEDANLTAEGFNPLCGDEFVLYLILQNDIITEAGFQGKGCAISKASTSMMTENIKGKSKSEALKLFESFRDMGTVGEINKHDAVHLGDLEILRSVSAFPVRIKCATLSWHALQSALSGERKPVSTE